MMALTTPDPALMFPEHANLIPQIFLRNAGSSPLDAAVTLDWRSPVQRGSLPLPAINLGSGAVRVLDLTDFTRGARLPADAYWGTVVVKYQGLSGDLIPVATSFDATGRYGLQTAFSEDLSRLWKGSMWHVDARRNSLITTGNGGSAPTHAALTLFYNNGKSSYTIEQQLEPGEQIWANVGELIRNQIPDKDGKTIPPDVTMGSYELRDLDHRGVGYLYEGKLVLDKTWGHGYYGCAQCCGFQIARLDPNPFSGMIGTGGDDFAEGADCNANWYDVTGDAYNWASSNTNVATLAKAYTDFVGVGSAFGSSDVLLDSTAYHCPQKTFTPGNTMNTLSLTCSPSTVSWGGSVSCTIRGASASQVTQWTFSAPGIAVNGPVGSLVWSGPMVVSGTVSAVVAGVNLTQTVGVAGRSTFPNVTLPAPQLVANGGSANGVTLPTLTSPPTTAEGTMGYSGYAYGFNFGSAAASSGPNAGVYYLTSFTDSSAYIWELNPGLTNPNDPFYQHQGNCFPTVTQIVSAVQAHEAGVPGPSHYSEVQSALASNNPALQANAFAGPQPQIRPDIKLIYSSAASAGATEPPLNLPPNINYPPYRTCPQ